MEAAKYIVNHLKEEGVKHAFLINGGVIAPVIDAFDKKENLEFICTTHEQGAAIAAEAYSRVTENLGVAIATSGPGATNLITGIGCAYFDSIPTLYITGQVPTHELTWRGGPRQVGFQETDIASIVKPITKYSKQVKNPNSIKYELEKAIYLAKSGRPGPVLLDLPMDVQRTDINPEELPGYYPEKKEVDYQLLSRKIEQTIELIKESERPVLILGAGVKLGKTQKRTKDLVEKLGIPVLQTWGAMDVLPYNHPLFVEGFGVSHNRAGNFTVQNSDLLISLGARLDTRETGGRPETFARGAKKVVVDIDSGELYKERGVKIDVDINYDLKDFIDAFSEKLDFVKTKDLTKWKSKINEWKGKFPICKPEYFHQTEKVNPYVFMESLSKESKEGDIIITDAGSNLTWTMQSWKVKENQKLFSAFGNSPMGYSLPASIGASIASNNGPVTCIIGDGGIKMNINELETIVRHNLPIKIFLINNHEYGIIKQFQDTLFGSRYKATSYEGGLGESDLMSVANSFGIPATQINSHYEMPKKVREILGYSKGPILCSVELKKGEKIRPKLEYGRPIEDPAPFLDREEFKKEMIIPLLADKK
ncbi:MAG: thiamine pyrophosphate-binding protein [archaeon]|nr:thiamine pyrophosphate-binding protein [archaeon]